MLRFGVVNACGKVEKWIVCCRREVSSINNQLSKDEETKVQKLRFVTNYDQLKKNAKLSKRKINESAFEKSKFENSRPQKLTSKFESKNKDSFTSRLETDASFNRTSEGSYSYHSKSSDNHPIKLSERLNECENLASLKDTIDLVIGRLSSNDLELIFNRLDYLLKNDMNDGEIFNSSLFKRLIFRTADMSDQLSQACLTTLSKLIDLINLSEERKIRVTKKIARKRKVHILKDSSLNEADSEQMLLSLCIRLKNNHQINQLIWQISPHFLDQLNLKQRLYLLEHLIESKYKIVNDQNAYKKYKLLLSDLITNSTNLIISEEDAWFYISTLSKLENKTSELPLLYYLNNLNKIGKILNRTDSTQSNYKLKKICDLVCKASNHNIFPSLLIKLLMSNIEKINLSFTLYLILNKFMFPFICQQKLINKLFTYHNWKQIDKLDKVTCLHVIIELILSDILVDENFTKFYLKLIDHVNADLSTPVDKHLYKKLSLAKIYLSDIRSFTEIESKMRNELEHAFDDLFVSISIAGQKPNLNNEYFIIDERVQENAYLSNGLYLDDIIAIFDEKSQNLISLKNFKNYFHQIDKAPLEEEQVLLALIKKQKYKVDPGNIDTNFDFKYTQVLERLGIMPIKLNKDEYTRITQEHPIENVIKFMVQEVSNKK